MILRCLVNFTFSSIYKENVLQIIFLTQSLRLWLVVLYSTLLYVIFFLDFLLNVNNANIIYLKNYFFNRIGGVMVSMHALSAVECMFEPKSHQTRAYKIGICCFSDKHAASRRKNKERFVWNQDNVSEWGDMSSRKLLFQWASTIKIQLGMLV